MICPKCNSQQADGSFECLDCGIVFEKYQKYRQRHRNTTHQQAELPLLETAGQDQISFRDYCRELLFYIKPDVNPVFFGGRVLLLLIVIIWGMTFIFSSVNSTVAGDSFLHLINLPFHEAGHIIFRPFGRFMTVLGGSLMQLIIPLVCMIIFMVRTRDPFGASIALWWLGQSFTDLAPYINDARSLNLILLGGVTGRDVPDYHDWQFILGRLDLLRYDHALALSAHIFGSALMLIAFLWGGYILYGQFRNIRSS